MQSNGTQSATVLETTLDLPLRRGKVRDVYDLGQQLLLVSTDRLSAFDWVLPTGIPDKGHVLTQISKFWFGQLRETNHLITDDLTSAVAREAGVPIDIDLDVFGGRSILVQKDPCRAHRVCRARLPLRLGVEGIPTAGHGLWHPAGGRPR